MKATHYFSLILFSLLCACHPAAPTVARYELPMASPETQQMQAQVLATLDTLADAYVQEKKLPGMEAMVIRNGKIVYHQAIGYSHMETSSPLKINSLYRVASMTKPITTVAALILMEEGRFQLDDPISKYIPEFSSPQVLESLNPEDGTLKTVPAEREVTIRDLMTHTSGIGYSFVQPEAAMIYGKAGIIDGWTLDSVTLGEKMKVLAGLPLLHQPGEKWTYGLSIDMIGHLVEVLSGQSLAEFMQAHIFDPLGMDDTGFYLNESQGSRLLPVYGMNEHQELRPAAETDMTARKLAEYTMPDADEASRTAAIQQLMDFPLNGAKTYFAGGAGLVSSTENYARFAQMLTNGGELNGVRILKTETVKLMASNQYKEDRPFGLGVSVSQANPNALHPEQAGAFGWGGYFKTRYWSDPSEALTVVIMTQANPNPFADEFMDKMTGIIYSSLARENTMEAQVQ